MHINAVNIVDLLDIKLNSSKPIYGQKKKAGKPAFSEKTVEVLT
jgi:hypothetical protein